MQTTTVLSVTLRYHYGPAKEIQGCTNDIIVLAIGFSVHSPLRQRARSEPGRDLPRVDLLRRDSFFINVVGRFLSNFKVCGQF